eukprot:439407-Karenia_brevis.AAC.1
MGTSSSVTSSGPANVHALPACRANFHTWSKNCRIRVFTQTPKIKSRSYDNTARICVPEVCTGFSSPHNSRSDSRTPWTVNPPPEKAADVSLQATRYALSCERK